MINLRNIMYHKSSFLACRICLFVFTLFLMQVVPLHAQSNATIRRLQREHNVLQNQINKSQTLLSETKKSVGHELADLQALEAQLMERKRYVERIELDMRAIDREVLAVTNKIVELEKQLKERKDQYAYSVRYLRKQSSVQQRLIFIFSANSFDQMLRRMRYVMEYADYQKKQVASILEKKQEVEKKHIELQEVKKAKVALKKHVVEEKEKLQHDQNKQKSMLAKLKRKRNSLQKQLKEQQRRSNALNKLIEDEIDKEVKRVAKLEEIRKARERKHVEKKSNKTARSASTSMSPRRSNTSVFNTMKTYSTASEIGEAFVQYKRRLPYPITGTYAYLSHFNKAKMERGIKIYGEPSCKARAVFQGVVTVVFDVPSGARGIILRHGSYMTVYCNLKTITVHAGEKVKQGQMLGEIYADPLYNNRPVLLFEVRRGREALDPDTWLNR